MRRIQHATTDDRLYAALCTVPQPGHSVIALAALDETCDCMLQRQAFPTLATLQLAVRTARRTHSIRLSRKTLALYLHIAQSITAPGLRSEDRENREYSGNESAGTNDHDN